MQRFFTKKESNNNKSGIIYEKHHLRVKVLIFAFSFFYSYIAFKLIHLFVSHYGITIIRNNYSDSNVKLKRSDILDRNMQILASTLPVKSLFIHPYKIQNKEYFSQELSKVIKDIDREQLLKKIDTNKNFVWIKRNVTPQIQEKIYSLGLAGIETQEDFIRSYPHSNLISHVLGYTDLDNNGIAGIEKYFDKLITSEEKGKLILSLDLNIQSIVYHELDKAISKFKAIGGIGIVANPKNGEILALVSKPDFNPNKLSSTNQNALFNQASSGLYELGSVFKTITLTIALDTDKTSLNDAYYLQNFKVSNLTVKDYHKSQEGWYSTGEIFIKSSNIGMAQIASEVSPSITSQYYDKLGFYSNLAIELPEKSMSAILPQEKWSKLALVTMSYGYQMATTPLHFIQALIPVVNGGFFCPVTLLKQNSEILNLSSNRAIEGDSDSKLFENIAYGINSRCKQVLNPKTSYQMNKLLYAVTNQGTGRKAKVPGYLVGGKSGTAEKVVKGKYSKNKRRSSFFGVFPIIDPQYIIYILLDEPQGDSSTFYFATGGYTAAPTVGRIIEKIAALKGITPYDEDNFAELLEVPIMHKSTK